MPSLFGSIVNAIVPGAGDVIDIGQQALDVYNAATGDDFSGGGGDTSGGGADSNGAPRLPTRTRLRFPASQAQVDVATGGTSGGTMDSTDLVYKAQDAIGRSISKKKIVAFIRKWGWQVASCVFQLSAQEQMMLVASQATSGRGRRGPHLYTVLKRIRSGDRYRKMLARYAAKAHAGGHRRSHAKSAGNVVHFRRKAK